MRRYLVAAYALTVYALFCGTLLYAIGFVSGLVVPKTINTGPETAVGTAVLVNVTLLALFAVQHTIMARPAFKRWWTNYVPQPIERATFVLAASLLLGLLLWQWRPITTVIWQVDAPLWRTVLTGVSLAGWATMLYSSFLIDHFDLFGLRQAYFYFRGRQYQPPQFTERSLYRYIRHPLMAGFLIAFWATPTMTAGHLLFAAVTTAYIFVGITLEERDLVREHGESYRLYRQRTSMIVPLPRRRDAANTTIPKPEI